MTFGKCLLSLFDSTGHWAQPFQEAGWRVICVDLTRGDDIRKFSAEFLLENYLQDIPSIDGILAAPPCTDFTVSGNTHWARKDTDGTTQASLNLVLQVLRCVDFLQPDFWALENPVGRLPRLLPDTLGKAAFSFDPWEYAGWMAPTSAMLARLDELRATNGRGAYSPEDEALVRDVGAYTKKTQLWGDFIPPDKKPIPNVKMNPLGSWLLNYGGKSAKTKAMRSITPMGFARAFCDAQLRAYTEISIVEHDLPMPLALD